MPFSAIEVEGLADLDRSFGKLGRLVRARFREGMRLAAQPVATLARDKALANISGMQRARTVDWSLMRVGGSNVVYVAPLQRGRASRRNPARKRPNLADLLIEKSLEPAAEQARPIIEARARQAVEQAIKDL